MAAIIIGIPLGYVLWFPLGLSEWHLGASFLVFFLSGFLTIYIVTLLTRPESKEVLVKFYRTCRPPGFWGPIAKGLSIEERKNIARETVDSIINGGLGLVMCLSIVATMTSLFGLHFPLAGLFGFITILSGFIFIRRWKRQGVFSGL
jgi:hypothetical protein